MMKPFALFAILALTACDLSHDASGSLNDGSTVKVERIIAPAGPTETFNVVSTEGWRCTGAIQHKGNNTGAVHTIPLACSNGATGTAKITFPSNYRAQQVNLTAQFEFTLSNGKSGKFVV